MRTLDDGTEGERTRAQRALSEIFAKSPTFRKEIQQNFLKRRYAPGALRAARYAR